jgi:hypothetical protein
MLLAVFRIWVIVGFIVEPRELPLLERVSIIRCHDLAPLVNDRQRTELSRVSTAS